MEYSAERVQTILAWKKNPSYKRDTMAGRILLYLKENGVTQYKDLVQNERFNYKRNLNNLKDGLRNLEKQKQYLLNEIKEYQEKGFKHSDKDYTNDVRLHTLPDGEVMWGIYKYSEKDIIEELPKDLRWLTVEEHIDHYKEWLSKKEEIIQRQKDKIKDIESRPGIYFEGSDPGGDNYSQLIATMVVKGTIIKVARGQYKISDLGLEILKMHSLFEK